MTKVKEAVGSGDDFFKVVMLSKKGKRMLEQIIGQVLGKEVEILEFINTELGKTQKIEKNKRIDVIVKIDGVIANVEVNTNDYNYVKFFRNFAYLVNLFNRYSVKEIDENEKIYDLKTDPTIKFTFHDSESGSSGGLMTALEIYDRLMEEDLTKGKTIVGTGTIDAEGNVGEISGVKYKLKGAVKEKADLFFVPDGDNYEEAKKVAKEKGYEIELVPVKTFDESVEYLKNME